MLQFRLRGQISQRGFSFGFFLKKWYILNHCKQTVIASTSACLLFPPFPTLSFALRIKLDNCYIILSPASNQCSQGGSKQLGERGVSSKCSSWKAQNTKGWLKVVNSNLGNRV